MSDRLDKWNALLAEKDFDGLKTLLADDVEFHSPFIHSPKHGPEILAVILQSIIEITENFTYHRQFVDGDDMALEFAADIGDLKLKGIDLIHWNENGQIDHFEVLIRPANALMAVGQKMTERLAKAGMI